jgi:hemolysin D
VPLDSRLEIEAIVPNYDVGFVRAGQEAEIKVDTFNFTKYGLLHGSVLNVSKDAIDQRKPPTDSGNTAKPNTDSASSRATSRSMPRMSRSTALRWRSTARRSRPRLEWP